MTTTVGTRGHAGLAGAAAPTLSVVIPCAAASGRAGEELSAQLRSLVQQDYDGSWEVVIADNDGSGAVEELASAFVDRLPRLQVVPAAARRGKPYAVNTAVRRTTGRVLVLLDSDDTVDPGYLGAVARASEDHEVLGARLDPVALNETWLQGRRRALQHDGLERLLDHHPAVVGAGLSLTREAWDAVGGFDERMGRQEDVDLSWRLAEAGYDAAFVPGAVVHYRYRTGLLSTWRQEVAYAEHEALLYRTHRSRGLRARPLRRTLGAWVRLLLDVRRAGTRAGRARLVTDLAAATGRLRGSLRYRVRYL